MRSTYRKIVVVAGGTAGVGRATSVAFARAGWTVAVLARGAEGLAGTAREIEELGGQALTLQVDMADAAAVMAAAERVEAELGPIDTWVNNAMVTIYSRIADTTPAEFRQVTDVTYLGQVHGTLAALKHMCRRDSGTIIHVGSALAYRSIPLQGPYCAAKAAVRGFVDALRTELLHEKSRVKVVMVQLPAVNTPQFDWARSRLRNKLAPVPPIVQPEAIGAAIVRAAHTRPREYWIGRSTVKAIVGQMLAPGYADRYLGHEGAALETVNQPAEPDRPDNLFEAGRGDPGAHGRFDDRSTPHAFPFNPLWLRLGAAAIAYGVVTASFAAGRASSRQLPRIQSRHTRQIATRARSARLEPMTDQADK